MGNNPPGEPIAQWPLVNWKWQTEQQQSPRQSTSNPPLSIKVVSSFDKLKIRNFKHILNGNSIALATSHIESE